MTDETQPTSEDVVPSGSEGPPDLTEQIEALLPEFLPRQRWYVGEAAPAAVEIVFQEVHKVDPLLVWLLVDVDPAGSDGGAGRARYQLVLGGRPVDNEEKFLLGKERVTLGEVDGLVLYDALVDPDLALEVLAIAAPDEPAKLARPLLVEQSNTSVVYDERLILKLFRQVQPGTANPDVEVNRALADRGFPNVVPQRAELRWDDTDLVVVRDYLLGATDAWHLSHTSLRDLLASRADPADAGGDFAPDAAALGEVTAQMHIALAEAFGTVDADPEEWLDGMLSQLDRIQINGVGSGQVAAALRARIGTARAGGVGAAFRIHGDLHLGQFMFSDTGWYVLDFEGEPDRPLAERQRASSPLRDVAGVLRSFHYASRAVLVERGRDVDPQLAKLAEAWEARSVEAFWRGYLGVGEVAELLPPDDEARRALLGAFELDKAVYEVGYERAHRPRWVDIPLAAVERLVR